MPKITSPSFATWTAAPSSALLQKRGSSSCLLTQSPLRISKTALRKVCGSNHGCARRMSSTGRAGEGSTTASPQEIQVTLRRPLGMTLAEDAERKKVFVEELVSGGNAESSGRVAVGDVVSKVSATVLKAGKDGQYEKEGYGQRPYDNWDKIMFDCTGQDFKTVMSAIDSNNPRWGINDVTLVLKREQS